MGTNISVYGVRTHHLTTAKTAVLKGRRFCAGPNFGNAHVAVTFFAMGKNPSTIGMINPGKGKRLGQCIPWLRRVETVTDGVVSMRYHSGNRRLLH